MFNIGAAQSAMEEFYFHICVALKQGIWNRERILS